MQNDDLQRPIWGCRSLPEGSGNYLDFRYDAPPEPPARPSRDTLALLKGQKLFEVGEYRQAADVFETLAASDDLARRLLLDCLLNVRDMPRIIDWFDPPLTATEAIYVMDALWAEGRHDRLHKLLAEPIVADSSDPSVTELRKKYSARLKK
jgi:hypothetical protein